MTPVLKVLRDLRIALKYIKKLSSKVICGCTVYHEI